jgi:5-methylcytosine-specific restriction endonuclease McrA
MRPRLRLDPEAYRQLYREVLERDGWRCQWCGRMENLQVHHIQWRSRLGDDVEENLITLCCSCHGLIHGATSNRIPNDSDRSSSKANDE